MSILGGGAIHGASVSGRWAAPQLLVYVLREEGAQTTYTRE